MDPIYHSADLNLGDLLTDCEGFEAGESVKLTNLQAAKVTIPVGTPEQKFNRALYVDKPNLAPIQRLFFRKVTTPTEIAQAASDALAGGFSTKLFDGQVFVEGSSVRVVGFGKP